MKKKFLAALILMLAISQLPQAQTKAADSVVIRVGEGSKVIFAIKDKKDLETLKQYDFQALMNDLINKLENKDTAISRKPSVFYLKDSVKTEKQSASGEPEKKKIEERWSDDNDDNDDDDNKWSGHEQKKSWGRRTYHSFNIDLGTNNYLSDGKFPDHNNELYTVKPWGSWYVGFNSIQRTRLSRIFL